MHREKLEEKFLEESKKIIVRLREIELEIYTAMGGNKLAAQRSRTKLIELHKVGIEYRRLSIEARNLRDVMSQDDKKVK